MMKHKKKMVSLAFLLLVLGGLSAQESPTTAGGKAIGIGGEVSYSVGQAVYTSNMGTNGSLVQGVQQPYEISVITGVSENKINIKLSAYPNPTTDLIKLKVESKKLDGLSFQLTDMMGKILRSNTLSNSETTINMRNLAKANYFVKIMKDNEIVKTFKIIKY